MNAEELAAIITMKQEQREKATVCPKGGMHQWTYSRPRYRCNICGLALTKDELKAATDRDVIELTL